MIGARDAAPTSAAGDSQRDTAELRPPERQRGLLSFLTWPFLLVQAAAAGAAFADKPASPPEADERALARPTEPDKVSVSDPPPHPVSGGRTGEEAVTATEDDTSGGSFDDGARLAGPAADADAPAALRIAASGDDLGDADIRGGGGGSRGSRATGNQPDDTPAVNTLSSGGLTAVATVPDAAQPAVSSLPGALTGIVDGNLDSAISVVHGLSPALVDVTGTAASLLDVTLQPVAAVLDAAPPLVTGLAGTLTGVADVSLDAASTIVAGLPPAVVSVAEVATGLVDAGLQPVASVLDAAQPVVAGVAGPLTDVAGVTLDTAGAIVAEVPATVAGAADAATNVVDATAGLVEPVLDAASPAVQVIGEAVTGVAGAGLASGAAVIDSAPPAVTAVGGTAAELLDAALGPAASAPDAAEPTEAARGLLDPVAQPLMPAEEDRDPVAQQKPAAIVEEAGGVDSASPDGGLHSVLASGGVITFDGGSHPPESAPADTGRYTDYDLALRNGDAPPAESTGTGSASDTAETASDADGPDGGTRSTPGQGDEPATGPLPIVADLTNTADESVLRGGDHLL